MIPFGSWLHYAVAALGLTPPAFWALTIAEWRTLTMTAPAQTLGRRGLDALIALYPDHQP